VKKKLAISVAVIVVIVIMGYIWWSSPVHFLDSVNVDDVLSVEVFNGNSGEGFTIENKNDISYIVSNIQNITMKREKISFGYMGYGYRLKFYNGKGKKIDEFIVNSKDMVRKDPFFYTDTTGNLCEDYLKGLEELSK
jgi:hypothetical protein